MLTAVSEQTPTQKQARQPSPVVSLGHRGFTRFGGFIASEVAMTADSSSLLIARARTFRKYGPRAAALCQVIRPKSSKQMQFHMRAMPWALLRTRVS